ncbi:MAG: ABC transporter ATP-binding protein, partial [Burkholderiales bacterium]|nr:ABC transporter ATP-binding protein [Burkholderiales bacterium]
DIVRDYRAARAMIGLVPQELATNAFESVIEDVTFSRGLWGKPRNPAHIEKVLKDVSLWDKRDAKIMTLSGGMKRRLLIAKALSHEPQILFLDEPTAGVDVELRQGLWHFIRELNQAGHTIVLTTHYLEEAEALCGRIAMLKHGRIISLDTTRNLLEHVAGVRVRLRLEPDRLPQPLAGWRVGREGNSEVLQLPDYAAIEPMLGTLREGEVAVQEMEVMQADLEDVFVQMMQKS